MKKILLYISLVLFAFSSCNLLDETDVPFPQEETYYKTENQCRSVVNGVYIPIVNIITSNATLAWEACTDLWYSGSSTQDAQCNITPSKPEFGATVWRQGYRGVNLCNDAIADIGKTTAVSDSIKNVMIAECRVMRALYYYYLTNMFNGVPFYTCEVKTYAVEDSLRYLPRTDANKIRQFMYDDLKTNALPYFTSSNGYYARTSEISGNRAGAPLALMLMAKFAMWYGDWDSAISALDELEGIYGEFNETRYPLANIMWSVKNPSESIFEIQHEYDVNGVMKAGTIAKFMMPPRDSSYYFNGVLLYGYGNSVPNVSSLRTNFRFAGFRTKGSGKSQESNTANSLFGAVPLTYDEYDSSIGRYTVKIDMDAIASGLINGSPMDKRALYKFGLGNLENGETFTNVKNYGYLWCGPEFWCPGIINSNDSNNYRLFRYADALLMLAECYCVEQNSSKSLHYLNLVRTRAGVEEISSFSGYEDLMLQIRNERARELAGELHRKFDLVRWGIWYNQTYSNTNNSKLKANMRPCHEYYPIPDVQCSYSGYILDNPTYKEYDMN